MFIDVVLNPAEIALLPQRDLSRTTCAVFDVLRATSSMITALAHGASEIYPVCTIEDARAKRLQLPNALLGGERNGDPIEGFDVGNNPLDYTGFSGRQIITTTTNGTVALRSCEHAPRVLVGALLNLDALCASILSKKPENVLLVCAGTFETFALEDAYAAGLLVTMLGGAEVSDSALTVSAMARQFSSPLQALLAARNGRALANRGWKEQVEFCAMTSKFMAVGTMVGGVITTQ